MSPITRALPPSHGMAKSFEAVGCTRTVCFTHSGTSGLGYSSTGAPRLSTMSGSKLSRPGSRRRSAT
jgi:hypothetical protein